MKFSVLKFFEVYVIQVNYDGEFRTIGCSYSFNGLLKHIKYYFEYKINELEFKK